MPTGFAAHDCRRPAVLVAVWLVVIQAFLAGLATGRAGALLSSDQIDVICHGSGASGGGDGSFRSTRLAPDGNSPDTAWHLCCAYCLSAAPAVSPPDAPGVAISELSQAVRPLPFPRFTVIISPGAVRAGPSRAPPRLA